MKPNLNGLEPVNSPRPLGGCTEGLFAYPVSRRADREAPAAWRCCRQLSGMCDRPIVAAPMASPMSVTIDVGARLSLWTAGQKGACKGV